MAWFQPVLRDPVLEPDRTAAVIRALQQDARVGKVFVEPPLAARLGVAGGKARFQGALPRGMMTMCIWSCEGGAGRPPP